MDSNGYQGLISPCVWPEAVLGMRTLRSQAACRLMIDVDRREACKGDSQKVWRETRSLLAQLWGTTVIRWIHASVLTWALADSTAHRIIVIAFLACSSAFGFVPKHYHDSATLNEVFLLGCSVPSTWKITTHTSAVAQMAVSNASQHQWPPQLCRKRT